MNIEIFRQIFGKLTRANERVPDQGLPGQPLRNQTDQELIEPNATNLEIEGGEILTENLGEWSLWQLAFLESFAVTFPPFTIGLADLTCQSLHSIMILENSGKMYMFPLDFDLGYAYAQTSDSTDMSALERAFVSVFGFIGQESGPVVEQTLFDSGVVLGPAPLYKIPNVRGRNAWRYMGQSDNILVQHYPVSKQSNASSFYDNWYALTDWHKSTGIGFNHKAVPCDYESIRHLEAQFLQSNLSIMRKVTMMQIVERGENVADYYDVEDGAIQSAYVQLVNTYYPLEQSIELLSAVPIKEKLKP